MPTHAAEPRNTGPCAEIFVPERLHLSPLSLVCCVWLSVWFPESLTLPYTNS